MARLTTDQLRRLLDSGLTMSQVENLASAKGYEVPGPTFLGALAQPIVTGLTRYGQLIGGLVARAQGISPENAFAASEKASITKLPFLGTIATPGQKPTTLQALLKNPFGSEGARQISGQTIEGAGFFTPVGKLSGALRPALGKTLGLATSLGLSGYGIESGYKLQRGDENALTPGLGTAIPAAIPLIGKGLSLGALATRSLYAKTSGISTDTVDTILRNPDAVSQAEKEGLSRVSLGELIDTRFKELNKSLSSTGKAYTPIRASTKPITFEVSPVETALKKFNIGIDNAGKLVLSAESPSLSAGDKSALQGWIQQYGVSNTVSPNAFLNAREGLDILSSWQRDPARTKWSEDIARSIREEWNKMGRFQIPDLAKLDAKYAPKVKELNNLKKEYLQFKDRQWVLKDTAVTRIANATNKGREQILARLEKYVPGITQQIQLVRTLEDITSAKGSKVGAYLQSILLGGSGVALATGNPLYALVGLLVTLPHFSIPILMAFGKINNIASSIIRTIAGKLINGTKLTEEELQLVKQAIINHLNKVSPGDQFFASPAGERMASYVGKMRPGLSTRDVTRDPFPEDAFKGFTDLSTKLLEKLKGRTTVSRQFIEDLTNSADLKQPERDLIRRVLGEFSQTGTTPSRDAVSLGSSGRAVSDTTANNIGGRGTLQKPAQRLSQTTSNSSNISPRSSINDSIKNDVNQALRAEIVGDRELYDFISKVRGSATQFGEYNPTLRKYGIGEKSKRISDLGIDPNQEITIYRGISEDAKHKAINEGDFVTTSYEQALAYTDSPQRVVSKKVKASDLITQFPDEFLDDVKKYGLKTAMEGEVIYSKSTNPILNISKEDLTKFFNDVKSGKQANIFSGSNDQISVPDFANRVKSELLPLQGKHSTTNYEGVTLPDELRGPVTDYKARTWQSPIKTSAGNEHPGLGHPENYFAHTRIEDLPVDVGNARMTELQKKYVNRTITDKEIEEFYKLQDKAGGAGIRRVIEIQSDLFQKGRLEGEIASQKARLAKDAELSTGTFSKEILEAHPELARANETAIKNRAAIAKEEAELSKLEPYRNTWHERIIREEVKQAALDGKTKLQFPTGETAMKIEGLGESNRFIVPAGADELGVGAPAVARDLKVGNLLSDGENGWIITDVLGDGKFKAIQKDNLTPEAIKKLASGAKINELGPSGLRIANFAETFDISGKVDTENPIYKFYEKEVGKYLKNKYGAQLITDPQGVKWWEINIKPEYKKLPIEAFGVLAVPPVLPNDQRDFPKSYPLKRGEQEFRIRQKDLDELAAILYGEISNRSPERQKLEARTIIGTVLNRMIKTKKPMLDLLQQANQYQAYGGKQYALYKNGEADPDKMKVVQEVIDELKNGDLSNPQYDAFDAFYYRHRKDGSIIVDDKKPLFK